jgi:hypothetical protein
MDRYFSNLTYFSAVLLISISATATPHDIMKSYESDTAERLWFQNQREAERLGLRNVHELKSYLTISEFSSTEDLKIFSEDELTNTDWLLENSTNSAVLSSPADGLGDALTNLGGDLGDIKRWMTVGQKIWEVVRNNQPVINVKTQSISVLPDVSPNWTEMETWRGPMAKSYTISAKNLYGATVISHTYTVAFHYGGSLYGRGQFLANATIIPTNVSVSWGFTLNSQVNTGQPLNTGTRANPIPGVDLGLEWSMSSVLKKTQGVDQFHVRGDGTSTHVNLY